MLTKGLNGTRWGFGKSSANKTKSRRQAHYPEQPCIPAAGWLSVEMEQPLLLNNSVMLLKWRARSGLMGDIWHFKDSHATSSVLKEVEMGVDVAQLLCWLLLPARSWWSRSQVKRSGDAHLCHHCLGTEMLFSW